MHSENAAKPSRSVLPAVAILATGGTIAGQAPDPDKPAAYDSGVTGVEALLQALPELDALARVKGVQVANIGSEHMTEDVWLRLYEVTQQVLSAPGVDGAVVLHGTDTLEETAFFLELTLPRGKPLVMTGAMRPANAVGADGPLNILNAVRLAAAPAARNRGVLIAMNDRILSARSCSKCDTLNVDAFHAPGGGPAGLFANGQPLFFNDAPGETAAPALFGAANAGALPRVEIIYGHAGQKRDLVDAAVDAGARGLVHAGVGMGHIHKDALPAFAEASRKGVAVVCASRIAGGFVPFSAEMARHSFIAAGDLSPQKARVLAQLSLQQEGDLAAAGAAFEKYVKMRFPEPTARFFMGASTNTLS